MNPLESIRSSSVASTAVDTTSSREPKQQGWMNYPFEAPTYNPLTEWGDHYAKNFDKDLWASSARFDVQELRGSTVSERRVSGSAQLENLLNEEEPDVRIFYCDSKLCDDLVTRASFGPDDVKKIFYHYDFSVIFIDRFVGRNRCTTGARKTRDANDHSKVLTYDVWYDLPCRILHSDIEYNWHFVLFTVYVRYNVVTKKTVLFYIHRLGSEHHTSAERSSRNIKDRIKAALEHIALQPNHCEVLNSCPFIIQLPTITSATTFWTETLHKERLDMWAKEDEGRADIASIKPDVLHNVNRYVHSYISNIKILQQTVEFVTSEHEWFAAYFAQDSIYNKSPWFETTGDCLKAQSFQLQAILTWTEEVLFRTSNLISLYFNRMSQMTSRTTGRIAGEAQKDSISMKTISLVTLVFLPSTCVSAVFSMPFFQKGAFERMEYLWVYALIATVLTVIVIFMWYMWQRATMRNMRKEKRDEFLLYP